MKLSLLPATLRAFFRGQTAVRGPTSGTCATGQAPLRPAGAGKGRRGERGYSLLEVLIVLTIIALIATLVGPRLMSQLDRSKATAARVQIKALGSALETMRLDLGRYPTQAEGLSLLVTSSGEAGDVWSGPYLEGALPKDPWGKDYLYQSPADLDARPRIGTLGADGKEGGQGNAADVFSDQG